MEQREKILQGLLWTALALCTPVLVLLFLGSMLGTSMLDPQDYWGEHILFFKDSICQNLLWLIVAILFLLCLKRLTMRGVSDRALRWAQVLLYIWILALGSFYIIGVGPEVSADSRVVLYAAEDLAKGVRTIYMQEYFARFPFQLGIVQYFELLTRIFGAQHYTTFALVNLALLILGYAALLQTIGYYVKDNGGLLLAVLLLAAFVPPIFYCTLLYGPIPCWSCMMLGTYLFVRYLNGKGMINGFLGALVCGIGVTMKINGMIFVIALFILLALHSIGKRKIASICFGFLAVAFAVLLPKLAVKTAEMRCDGSFSGQASTAANWLLIGLTDSDRAPGWYHETEYSAAEQAWDGTESWKTAAVRARIGYLAEHPREAREFFAKKIFSQWDEPTFQSIWVSRIKKLEKTMPDWIQKIYDSGDGGSLYQYLKHYVQTLYFLSAAGLLWKICNWEWGIPGLESKGAAALFPIIVLGGFIYHTIAEAKSQYVLLYLPLLIPAALWGIECLEQLWIKLAAVRKKAENRRMKF